MVGTLVYLPLLYLFFDLPKLIINDALEPDPATFQRDMFGIEFTQVQYLLVLCAAFFALMLITAGMRYVLAVQKGILSELMLRRLRYDIYTQILRFPLSHFRRMSGGEAVTVATAEAEPLGRYMGVAFANPVLQIGTLVTAMVFLFVQDWILGLAAIALFPVQLFIVPKVQRRMNAVSRRRLANLRVFAGHVSESIDGVREIHAHDTSAFERARASDQLGVLFRIRRRLYEMGNVILFLNGFFSQLTPFLFYLIGGYLVIKGQLSLGALVAVIAAYRETVVPRNGLLANYQQLEDNRLKYAQLAENFCPDGLRDLPDCDPANGCDMQLAGTITVTDLTLRDGEHRLLDAVSFDASIPGATAIVGPAGGGKSELGQVLCGLQSPSSGTIRIGDVTLASMDESEIGHSIGYVDQDSHVFSGSWLDNLLYGLKHRPVRPPQYDAKAESERAAWVKEASAAGNTTVDLASDWVDYASIGINDEDALSRWVTQVVKLVNLEDDLLSRGLQQLIKPDDRPDLSAKLLEARNVLLRSIGESDVADAVELFDLDEYNTNATLSENLLFGRHTDESFDVYHLGEQPYLLETLEKHDLLDRLTEIGLQTASTMLEMFRDLPEDDDRLERLSMIDRESMPEYEALVQRAERDGVRGLASEDRSKLLSLAFMQAPAHQRFGLIDEAVQTQIVAARHSFRNDLPAHLEGKVEFFDAEEICGGVTIQCNILFGRIAKSQNRNVINDLMRQAIDSVGIRDDLLCLGLDSNVGTAGSRLSPSQRQKVTLARALIKRPCLLILNEAINALDQSEQDTILDRILDLLGDQGLIWIDREREGFDRFDQILTMRSGRIVKRRERDAGTVETEKAQDGAGDHTVDEAMAVLQRVPFLQGLDPSTVKLLAYAGDQQSYDAGEIVFREGDEGETACFVLDGEATVSIGEDAARHDVGSLEPGDVVGEIALLLDTPRTATVTATSELTVLALSRELFVDLMRKDQELGISVMRTLAERLAATMQRIDVGADRRAEAEPQPG